MKLRFSLAILLSVFCFSSTFAATSPDQGQSVAVNPTNDVTNPAADSSNAQSQTTSADSSQNNASNKDGQIVAVLLVLNKNEIAAAKEAAKKSVNPSVKKFAAQMNRDHSKNLADTTRLSKKIGVKPVDSDDSNNLKEAGKKELDDLKGLKGQDFQAAYMDSMVKDHTDALNKLDSDLIQNANNPALKKHLEATRAHVAMHLEKAKEIQNNLKSAGSDQSSQADQSNQPQTQSQSPSTPSNQ